MKFHFLRGHKKEVQRWQIARTCWLNHMTKTWDYMFWKFLAQQCWNDACCVACDIIRLKSLLVQGDIIQLMPRKVSQSCLFDAFPLAPYTIWFSFSKTILWNHKSHPKYLLDLEGSLFFFFTAKRQISLFTQPRTSRSCIQHIWRMAPSRFIISVINFSNLFTLAKPALSFPSF